MPPPLKQKPADKEHAALGAPKKSSLKAEKVKTIIGIAMFAGALAFLFAKYLWIPFSARLVKAQTGIAKATEDIARAKAVSSKYKTAVKNLTEAKKQAEILRRRLPDTRDVPDVVRTFVRQSGKYAAKLNFLYPQPEKDEGFYTRTVYKMSITASYHTVGVFLSSLLTLERLFHIHNLTMLKADDEGLVEARFDLIAFKFKETK